eukprot:762505-Hanusia_phi.AAC.1
MDVVGILKNSEIRGGNMHSTCYYDQLSCKSMKSVAPTIKKNKNVLRRLLGRETLGKASISFSNASITNKFQNFSLQDSFDTHDTKAPELRLSFLKKRSKIIEIVAAKDIIFALTAAGTCVAFQRSSKQHNHRLCFLNTSPYEVIRSLFYNKTNNSIITVSVYKGDNFSSLVCRSTSVEYIRRGEPSAGFQLFESESLKYPGFVEFDDVNGKVLTFSASEKVYKIWDLKNYQPLYSITDELVHEIKISPGIMLLIYQKSADGGNVPLKIIDIENGNVLQSLKQPLHRTRKIDFIEQFNEKLLIKQEGEPLQIVDIRNGERLEIPATKFLTPSAFIFLYEVQLFLAFRHRNIAVWNFRGEMVTQFEDHTLWNTDCNTNNIYITSHQASWSCPSKHQLKADLNPAQGCIHVRPYILLLPCSHSALLTFVAVHSCPDVGRKVSSILDGRSLARIQPRIGFQAQQLALNDVTSLFYNEESNEIYTGNKDGHLHVWSN